VADGSTSAPLAAARNALDGMLQLTSQVTEQLDRGLPVLPQIEAAWRSQQDGLMYLAAAAALVSIAESLNVIATRAGGGGGG
jgi:hypothetical protein